MCVCVCLFDGQSKLENFWVMEKKMRDDLRMDLRNKFRQRQDLQEKQQFEIKVLLMCDLSLLQISLTWVWFCPQPHLVLSTSWYAFTTLNRYTSKR